MDCITRKAYFIIPNTFYPQIHFTRVILLQDISGVRFITFFFIFLIWGVFEYLTSGSTPTTPMKNTARQKIIKKQHH